MLVFCRKKIKNKKINIYEGTPKTCFVVKWTGSVTGQWAEKRDSNFIKQILLQTNYRKISRQIQKACRGRAGSRSWRIQEFLPEDIS